MKTTLGTRIPEVTILSAWKMDLRNDTENSEDVKGPRRHAIPKEVD